MWCDIRIEKFRVGSCKRSTILDRLDHYVIVTLRPYHLIMGSTTIKLSDIGCNNEQYIGIE